MHRAIPAQKLHGDLQQTAQATRGVVAQVVDLAGRIGVNDTLSFPQGVVVGMVNYSDADSG